jgi:hypothetical protein
MRARRRLLASIFLLGSACSGSEVYRLELKNLAIEAGALAMLNVENQVTRVSATFGFDENGELLFGALPTFTLEAQERGGVLIALDESALNTAVAQFRYQPSRMAEVRVQIKTPAAVPVLIDPDPESEEGQVETALPEATRMFIARTADEQMIGAPVDAELHATVRSSLRVTLPVDVEPCRIEGVEQLSPLAGAPNNFHEELPNSDISHFRDFARVGENHLALISWGRLRVIRLDETYVETSSNTQRHVRDFGAYSRVAVDPSSPPGEPRIYATTGKPRSATTPASGSVVVFSFKNEVLRYVETATTTAFELGDLAFTQEGRLVVGSGVGPTILDRAPGATIFESKQLNYLVYSSVSRVHSTENPRHPLLAAVFGRIFLWDSEKNDWISEDLNKEAVIAEVARVKAITSYGSGDDFQVWVSANDGQIFHRNAPGSWTRYELPQPPRAYACNEDGGPPTPDGQSSIETLSANAERLFATLSNCTPLFVLDHQVRCSSVILRGEDPVERELHGFKEVLAGEREVIVAGDVGALYRASW